MQLIAHRGCSAREIENTLPAFRAAIKDGADGIETDLRLARDGSLWLFHDDDFSRLANRSDSVESLDANSLRRVRLTGGARLALLDELLGLLRETPKRKFLLNLELKGSKKNQLALAAKISSMEQAGEFRGLRIVVSSFNQAALRELRERSADIPLAALWSGSGLFASVLKAARALKAEAVHLAANAVTRRRLAAIRKAGLLARVYTVNEPAFAKKFAALGVHGIFSDDPEEMRSGVR